MRLIEGSDCGNRRQTLRRVSLLAGTIVALFAVASVEAYLFFGDGRSDDSPFSSDNALRWSSDIWPAGETLRYEIAPDPDFEVYFDAPDGVVPFVEQALAAWEEIPTADISWRLDGVGNDDRAGRDGVSSVFLDETTLDDDGDAWCGGYAAHSWSERSSSTAPWETVECDVAFCAGYASIPDWVEPEDLEEHRKLRRENSVYMLVHEFGHCLGLGHAGDLSITGRWDRRSRTSIHPGDPVMSYGFGLDEPDDLSADDIVGASLLRPQTRFERGSGRVAGVVRVGGEPAPYVHVWALPVGMDALRDRVGVFSNGEGEFLIEGLDPGEYAFWAQPIASQGANQHLLYQGAPTDLEDTLVGRPVLVLAGRTAENVEISMRRGRTPRPPPGEVPPRRDGAHLTVTGTDRAEVCRGVSVGAERPYPADGPLWFSERDFSLGRDRWWRTTVTVEWSPASSGVILDWAGAYRNWWWRRSEDEEEHAEFFAAWSEEGDSTEQLGARSPRLDVSISAYGIDETSSGVRHVMDIAWPEFTEATFRFRSEDDSCDGEPLVVCDLSGCAIRPAS